MEKNRYIGNRRYGYWETYHRIRNKNSKILQNRGYYNVNGHKHGYWEEFNINSDYWFTGYYNNGLPDKEWTFYHEKNLKMLECKYINGHRFGYWKEYNECGDLTKISYFI